MLIGRTRAEKDAPWGQCGHLAATPRLHVSISMETREGFSCHGQASRTAIEPQWELIDVFRVRTPSNTACLLKDEEAPIRTDFVM